MRRLDSESAIAMIELEQLVAHYFFMLDETQGPGSTDVFTEDGSVTTGNMALTGDEAMRAFYEQLERDVQLAASGVERTTRHAYIPGTAPVPGATSPTIISDVQLRCRRTGADGAWRIFELAGRPIFSGSDPVLNRLLVD